MAKVMFVYFKATSKERELYLISKAITLMIGRETNQLIEEALYKSFLKMKGRGFSLTLWTY